MGKSWVLTITLEVPDRRRWLASTPDPSAFDDWPALLATDMRRNVKLSTLLGRLAKDRFTRLVWEGSTLQLAAVLSNDSSLWIDGRAPLAAAVRASEGKGELAIANGDDNTDATGVLVTPGGVEVLTGKRRTALFGRMTKVKDSIVRADLDREDAARRAEPLARDERIRPLHAEIVRALDDASEASLLRAAATLEEELTLVHPASGRTYATFAELFGTKRALLDALAHGDPRVESWCAATFVAASLTVLDHVAPQKATALAEQVLSARARHPASQTVLEAALAVVSRAESDDVAAALRRLRKTVPSAGVGVHHALQRHALVRRILRDRPADAEIAITTAVAKVLGTPGSWKAITDEDASYGFVLLHLLEQLGCAREAAALRTHPHWMIARAPATMAD